MARPQNNPGMPSNTRSVSASPVDLTEFTGNAGMPVSPTPLAKPPAQPDLQAYRDSQALASSFSTLSATLGQYGMSVERVGQMYEDFGEETAGLVEFLKSEGKTFANALSTDQIEALEHPRAMVGASRGTAKLRAREMDSMFSEGLSELKLGDGALDPDTYAKAYDSMIAPYIQNYKGPRSDVFSAEFLTEASRLRSGQMVKARKWISDELIKQGEQEINYEVDSILTAGSERERDSIVESDLYDPNDLNPAKAALGKLGFAKTKRIIGDTDEEHYEKVVSEAQLSLQNYIDGQEGEMFSLRNVTEIAGKRLVQLAAGNSRMSGLAQELLNTPVGPKNGRVALKDHPAVREAYLNNEDRIRANSGDYSKLTPDKLHDYAKNHSMDFAMSSGMVYFTNPESSTLSTPLIQHIENSVVEYVGSPQFKENFGDYVRVRGLDEDVLVFRSTNPEINPNDREIKFDLKKIESSSRRHAFENTFEILKKRYEESMSDAPESVINARAIASSANHYNYIPQKYINQVNESIESLSVVGDQYFQLLATDPDAAPPRMKEFMESYDLYRELYDLNPRLASSVFRGQGSLNKNIMEVYRWGVEELNGGMQPEDAYSTLLKNITRIGREGHLEGFAEHADERINNLVINNKISPGDVEEMRKNYIALHMFYGDNRHNDSLFEDAKKMTLLHSHFIGGAKIRIDSPELGQTLPMLENMFGSEDPSRGAAGRWIQNGMPGMDEVWMKTNEEELENLKNGDDFIWVLDPQSNGQNWLLQSTAEGYPRTLHVFTYRELVKLTEGFDLPETTVREQDTAWEESAGFDFHTGGQMDMGEMNRRLLEQQAEKGLIAHPRGMGVTGLSYPTSPEIGDEPRE
tara:strand:- start:3854 stop:6439 length:2586 start_codon:yes stop_codon:yes gene_type:complete